MWMTEKADMEISKKGSGLSTRPKVEEVEEENATEAAAISHDDHGICDSPVVTFIQKFGLKIFRSVSESARTRMYQVQLAVLTMKM